MAAPGAEVHRDSELSLRNRDNVRVAESFFSTILGWPRSIIALSLVLLIVTGSFLPSLTEDMRDQAFMPPGDPVVLFTDENAKRFGFSDAVVLAVIDPSPAGVFRPDTLALVDWLTRELRTVKGIDPQSVTSLSTEAAITSTEEGMFVEPFFRRVPTTPAEAEVVRAKAMGSELHLGTLVTEDGKGTVVLGELLDPALGAQAYKDVLERLEEAPRTGQEIYVAGEGAAAGYLAEYVDADAMSLNPAAFLMLLIVLSACYRSVRGTFIPLFVSLGSVTVAIGTMAAAGVPFYVITSGLTVILIAISVADCVHILGQHYEEQTLDPEAPPLAVTARAMAKIYSPVLATSLTSAAGFLALSTAAFMPPMVALGRFAAIGVLAALVLSLFTVPAFLVLLRRRESRTFQRGIGSDGRPRVDAIGEAVATLGGAATRHPWAVVLGALAVLTAGSIGISRLRLEDERILLFHPSAPIRIADQTINERFDGTYFFDVIVETTQEEGLFLPENLRHIERLQSFLASLPRVGGATSIVDHIKQMNRAVNEGSPEAYTVPDDADVIAQYMLLYSASVAPARQAEISTLDYRVAPVRAMLNRGRISDFTIVADATEKFLREEFTAPGITARLSGPGAIEARRGAALRSGNLRGLAACFLTVWAATLLCFRSLAASLLTMVPVSSAVFVTYAVMGATGIWLSAPTVMTAALAIGLAVDPAVHTVGQLSSLVHREGLSLEEALPVLFRFTGRALFFDVLAISLCFGVLMMSALAGLREFGFLLVVCVSTSFIATISLLPALFVLCRPRFLTAASPSLRVATQAAVFLAAAGSLFASSSPVFAEDGALTANKIVKHVNDRDPSQQHSQAITIELIDQSNVRRVRETRLQRKKVDGVTRTAIYFTGPRSVRGTSFLTYDYKEEGRDDDQWLYLPAMRKIRRLSGSDRGDSFLGTDMTYEDMKLSSKLSADDYAWVRLDDEDVAGAPHRVIEGQTINEEVAEEIGYSRMRVWVDPSTWIPRVAEIWDVAGNPLKRVEVSDIRQIDGIWTPHHIEVANHKGSHRTILRISEVDYTTDIDESRLTQNALRRGP